MKSYEIIQAKYFTYVERSPNLIVIHTMESPEKPGTARAVANWFAGENAPKASAHYCIDGTEIIQCVRNDLIAWHAPGANARAIGVEHAGRAAQSRAEWDDENSRAILRRSAELVADLCVEYKIPPDRIGPEEVKNGRPGICGHVDVSRAFGKSDHYDPGPNFPWDGYIVAVRAEIRTPGILGDLNR